MIELTQMMNGTPMAIAAEHVPGLMTTAQVGVSVRDPEPLAAYGVKAGERYAVQRGVAVVPITGLLMPKESVFSRWLGWASYAGIAEACAEIALDEAVEKVVFDFDTPGGFVIGLDQAAAAIRDLATSKTCVALVSPMAASAGYWLASQVTTIEAVAGAVVGSVGVMQHTWGYVAPGARGEQAFDVTSQHANAKRPDPTTPEGMALVQSHLDRVEKEFHAAIAVGRGVDVDTLLSNLSVTDDPQDGGDVFYPEEAMARGLIDKIAGTRSAFYEAHMPKPKKAEAEPSPMAEVAPLPSGEALLAAARAAVASAEL